MSDCVTYSSTLLGIFLLLSLEISILNSIRLWLVTSGKQSLRVQVLMSMFVHTQSRLFPSLCVGTYSSMTLVRPNYSSMNSTLPMATLLKSPATTMFESLSMYWILYSIQLSERMCSLASVLSPGGIYTVM